MPTATERMLELSPLQSGSTAREHFLAISQTSNSGTIKVAEKILAKVISDSVSVKKAIGDVSVAQKTAKVSVAESNSSVTKVLVDDQVKVRVEACHKT